MNLEPLLIFFAVSVGACIFYSMGYEKGKNDVINITAITLEKIKDALKERVEEYTDEQSDIDGPTDQES